LAELARRFGVHGVESTPEAIRRAMSSTQGTIVPADHSVEPAAVVGGQSNCQHVADRLGWMWLRDTVLRHTDDWQREHQDRWIEIHPEDAKQLALRPGWVVQATGVGGEFQARTRVSDRVARGILVTPHELLEGPVHLERAA
jgi:predicted molibdopterin-dependent oxidoreductase YjgC